MHVLVTTGSLPSITIHRNAVRELTGLQHDFLACHLQEHIDMTERTGPSFARYCHLTGRATHSSVHSSRFATDAAHAWWAGLVQC